MNANKLVNFLRSSIIISIITMTISLIIITLLPVGSLAENPQLMSGIKIMFGTSFISSLLIGMAMKEIREKYDL